MSARIGRNVPRLKVGQVRIVRDICTRHGMTEIRYGMYMRAGRPEMNRRCLICQATMKRARYRRNRPVRHVSDYPTPKGPDGRYRPLTEREKVTLEILEGLGR